MVELGKEYIIIKGPWITEKASYSKDRFNKYTFWVDLKANKIDIKRAIEKIYNVKVKRINTLILKGTTKRVGFRNTGKTSDIKKAIVTLAKGQEIKF